MHTVGSRAFWLAGTAALWCSLGLPLRATSPNGEADQIPPVAARSDEPGTAGDDGGSTDQTTAADLLETDGLSSDGGGIQQAIGSGAVVAVIRIEGMIYGFTLESLDRRLKRARELGADIIVVELETPGGVLDSALKISKLLKSVSVPTVAWINDEAYSAGILVASSCNEIVMARHSATGDCAPISMGGSLGPREVKKALGPLLAEFRDNAETNDFPYVLFQAMCVEGVKIYRVRNKRTSQIQFANEKDFHFMVHGISSLDPEVAKAAVPPSGTATANVDPVLGQVAQMVTAETDRGAWVLDDGAGKSNPIVYDGATFMTVTDSEAMDLGLAKAIVKDDLDLQTYLKASQVIRVTPTWSEGLAGWLTHPMVRGVLMLALLVGAYMEFQSPGLGVPGVVAAVALIVLIGAPFLVGLAEIWHTVLFFAGLMLLMTELFVIPGFGILGMAGLLCMLLGLILAIVPAAGPLRMPAPEMWGRLLQSTLWMLLGVMGGFIGLFYITKYFGNIPFLNRLILATPTTQDGAAGVLQAPHLPASGQEVIGGGTIAIGAEGRVVTGLHPIGQASIDGQTVDVISEGDWIEAGRTVRVTEVHGNKIVVEAAE